MRVGSGAGFDWLKGIVSNFDTGEDKYYYFCAYTIRDEPFIGVPVREASSYMMGKLFIEYGEVDCVSF